MHKPVVTLETVRVLTETLVNMKTPAIHQRPEVNYSPRFKDDDPP